MQQTKKEIEILENGKGQFATIIKTVPKYKALKYETEDGVVAGTEVFFEGKLWYPVFNGQKTGGSYSFVISKDQMFFFNPALLGEETELSIQSYFKEIDADNWRYYRDELINLSHRAIIEAFQNALNGVGNER